MIERWTRQLCGSLRAKRRQSHISEWECLLFRHEWKKAFYSHFIQLVAERYSTTVDMH